MHKPLGRCPDQRRKRIETHLHVKERRQDKGRETLALRSLTVAARFCLKNQFAINVRMQHARILDVIYRTR